MKQLLVFGVAILMGCVLVTPAYAKKQVQKAQVKLDAQNLSRAAQVVARNKALFQDRDQIQRLIKLSKGMKSKR